MKPILISSIVLLVLKAGFCQENTKPNTVIKVERLPFNTEYADHSPFFYKSGIIFVSNRQNNLSVVYTSETTDTPLSDLYFVIKKNGKWKKPLLMPRPITSAMSEGSASLTADTSVIYFTRNDVVGNKSKLNIYYSKKQKNGIWSAPILHPVNSEKFSCGHPAISLNNEFLIFASNMPGGMGGTDLYISYNKEGRWTKSKNLGKSINTSQNEITPFIFENNTLYFASNGQPQSHGGYDIYTATYSQFEWKNVSNLPAPINTSFNDFGYIINSDLSEGYFASNRENGGDDDDIYHFANTDEMETPCDSLKDKSLCRTFFEENTLTTKDENSPLTYQWDFGDGKKMKGNEVRYCYSKPGKYIIQLNIVDIISNQVYLNEATYELEIGSITGPYFSIPDTLQAGKEYLLDASASVLPSFIEKSYVWDMGTGKRFTGEKVNYKFSTPGSYSLKLTVNGLEQNNAKYKSCVSKMVHVLSKAEYEKTKINFKNPTQSLLATAKTIYSIKDSDGYEYKIQLATSKTSINQKFTKYEGILNIEEYFDRNVYGYTTGKFKTALEAYPTLNKIRKIGFTEALLIATHNGKVVSGDDSSFYINLPEDFKPLRIVTLKGKIRNKNGELLPAKIKWESLTTGDTLGTAICQKPLGEYMINLPNGDLYGYVANHDDYFPISNYIDLRKENDFSEITADIILYKAEELASDSTSVRISNIFFMPDKYQIIPESYPELKRLAQFIIQNKGYSYEIAGHTDHTGTAQYNQNLSEQRAYAVKNFLVKLGCNENKLLVKGYGNTRPATTNRNLHELNRRVEIKLFKNN